MISAGVTTEVLRIYKTPMDKNGAPIAFALGADGLNYFIAPHLTAKHCLLDRVGATIHAVCTQPVGHDRKTGTVEAIYEVSDPGGAANLGMSDADTLIRIEMDLTELLSTVQRLRRSTTDARHAACAQEKWTAA